MPFPEEGLAALGPEEQWLADGRPPVLLCAASAQAVPGGSPQVADPCYTTPKAPLAECFL